jgi:hypothetical protein
MQDVLFVFYLYGMTGIVSSLETGHHVGTFCEQVDNLAFSLVTPLGADNYYISHSLLLIILYGQMYVLY